MNKPDRAVVSGVDEFEIQTLDPDAPVPAVGLAFMPDGVYYDGVKLPGVWADTVTVRLPRLDVHELAHVELKLISINPLYVHPMHDVEQWPFTEDGAGRVEIHYGHA
ncbi:hypothetical protein ACHIPZ_13770 [Antrihabitans sp. NCIMB 15449]|uniref:Uncharacterized protein n=1 Tax=Antrihabitans spumae TaxID=3373370 RepID=A0ABW7JQ09_9NOCA